MAILLRCECGQVFQTPGENAGRNAVCPDCGRGLRVPTSRYVRSPDGQEYRPDARPRSGKARASLGLGLLSLATSVVAGLPALVLGVLALRDIRRSGGRIQGHGQAVTGVALGLMGCTVVLGFFLVPVGLMLREAERANRCAERMKRIGEAVQAYTRQHGRLPPAAVYDAGGQALMSWRVLILPYLGDKERQLAGRLRLDEPWNSPTNNAALSQMPDVFACPADLTGGRSGTTRFQVVTGPRTMFTGKKQGLRPEQVLDGMSHTAMVVEADEPVPWLAPAELAHDGNLWSTGVGSEHDAGVHVLMGDGAVRTLPPKSRPWVIEWWVTRDGGEVDDYR